MANKYSCSANTAQWPTIRVALQKMEVVRSAKRAFDGR